MKIDEDGTKVELVKIETEVILIEEYTGIIEVMELNIVVVLLAASTDLEDVPITLLLENPLEEEAMVDNMMELVLDTWGTRDGVNVELMKIDEDGTTVELVKIETDGTKVELVNIGTEVVLTDEYTVFIDVMELKWEVVLLVVSTDLEEVATKLLLENPLEVETIIDCTVELVFDSWGIDDGMRVELVKIEEGGTRVELEKIGTDVVFTEE